jgi:competence protein ComEC
MKSKYSLLLTAVLLLLIVLLTSCKVQSPELEMPSQVPGPAAGSAKTTKVHFIDVGQGDCTFIELNDGRNILIDGGNRADANVIIGYLKSLNIDYIDYIVATHPHEDHIGSLPTVINRFDIGSIYMPKVTANTKIFEELLIAIKEKNYRIETAVAGVKIIDTEDTKLTIIAPNSSEYQELNNYSAVAKLTYINTSFLFTGDAEDISEMEIIKENFDIRADLIKIGHHGGRTSTTRDFLEAAAPKYAVISVGADNDYGHPHKETIEKLEAMKLQIFRTDMQGSIIASSDGSSISINKVPAELSKGNVSEIGFYIGNRNSKIYHLKTCSGLPKLENQVKLKTKEEAETGGFEPCKICKP